MQSRALEYTVEYTRRRSVVGPRSAGSRRCSASVCFFHRKEAAILEFPSRTAGRYRCRAVRMTAVLREIMMRERSSYPSYRKTRDIDGFGERRCRLGRKGAAAEGVERLVPAVSDGLQV
jgi:hypothetical protein